MLKEVRYHFYILHGNILSAKTVLLNLYIIKKKTCMRDGGHFTPSSYTVAPHSSLFFMDLPPSALARQSCTNAGLKLLLTTVKATKRRAVRPGYYHQSLIS